MTGSPSPAPSAGGSGTDSEAENRQSTRGSAFALVATLIGAAANFTMLVLIEARYGARIFGVFSSCTALFILLTIVLRLGSDTGSTYFVARVRTSDERPDVRHLLASATTPVVGLTILVALIGFVASGSIAELLSPSAPSEYQRVLVVLATGIPAAAFGETLLGATRGFGSMRPTIVSSQLGRQVGQLGLVSLVSLATTSLTALAIAWVVPYLATIVYPAWWLRSRLAADADQRSVDFGAFWRYSAPQAANSSAQGGLEKLDIILIDPLLGSAEAVGAYSFANRITHLVVLAWYSINSAQAPVYAARFAAGRDAETGAHARKVAGWIALAVSPLLWMLLNFGERILVTLRESFGLASGALTVLALCLLVALLAGPSESLLLMSGGSGLGFINNTIALVANVGLNFVLIPRHGLVGAAWAWTISIWIVRTLAAVQVWRRRGVVVLGRQTLEALAITGVAFGATGALAKAALGDELWVVVGVGVVGVAMMVAACVPRRSALAIDELAASLGSKKG